MQGAVINVVTKQGGERFVYDGSYYGQASALTSQPVSLRYLGSGDQHSGYERAKYEDFTNSLGGPAIRDRLWFFAGYQWLRDYDSQPGTDPALPRTYEMQKLFAKLTWRLAPTWQLVQSFHHEIGIDPERPTIVTPFEATARTHISTPTMNFGDLTHTMSANTLWDVRVGRFVSNRRPSLRHCETQHPAGPGLGEDSPPARLDEPGVQPPVAGHQVRVREHGVAQAGEGGCGARGQPGVERGRNSRGQTEDGHPAPISAVPDGVRL
jgi:hypothetical protein